MSEALRFTVLKDHIQQNKIKLTLDRRKGIEYYNKAVAADKVKLSKALIALHYLSGASGFGLILGAFFIIFVDPWLHGLIICLTSVYVRYQAWKYLKNKALQYTYQQSLTSEEIFNELYKNNTIALKNNETGKIVNNPQKWSVVLPPKSEVKSVANAE